MKTYNSKPSLAKYVFNQLSEELRHQGDSHFSLSLFNLILGVFAFCVVCVITILSNAGMGFIKANIGAGMWIVGFILLSMLVMWAIKEFVKVWLMIWKMTKEE